MKSLFYHRHANTLTVTGAGVMLSKFAIMLTLLANYWVQSKAEAHGNVIKLAVAVFDHKPKYWTH